MGNYIQYPLVNPNGKEHENECIYMPNTSMHAITRQYFIETIVNYIHLQSSSPTIGGKIVERSTKM